MKIFQKTIAMIALAAIVSFSAQAAPESNAVKKAKEAVEEAAPYDWKTLASSAEICFKKKENTELALEWINKSIEINKDPKNLEIKADYFASIGEKSKALALYSEAINTGKEQNFWFDSSDLQDKIWSLR